MNLATHLETLERLLDMDAIDWLMDPDRDSLDPDISDEDREEIAYITGYITGAAAALDVTPVQLVDELVD